jgi:hypothetical protein
MFIYIFFLCEYFIISSRLHRALTVSISLFIHKDTKFLSKSNWSTSCSLPGGQPPEILPGVDAAAAPPYLEASLLLLPGVDAAAAASYLEASLLLLPGVDAAAAAPCLEASLLLLPGVDAAAAAPYLEASLLLLHGVDAVAAAFCLEASLLSSYLE